MNKNKHSVEFEKNSPRLSSFFPFSLKKSLGLMQKIGSVGLLKSQFLCLVPDLA